MRAAAGGPSADHTVSTPEFVTFHAEVERKDKTETDTAEVVFLSLFY